LIPLLKIYFIYKMAENGCKFLTVGRGKVCGQKCRGDYCYNHKYVVARRGYPARACLICGNGCYTELQICGWCNRTYSTSRLKEKISKIMVEKNMSYEDAKIELIKILSN
jgi:hypothetical protein